MPIYADALFQIQQKWTPNTKVIKKNMKYLEIQIFRPFRNPTKHSVFPLPPFQKGGYLNFENFKKGGT